MLQAEADFRPDNQGAGSRHACAQARTATGAGWIK
jgi:hypothetical protein